MTSVWPSLAPLKGLNYTNPPTNPITEYLARSPAYASPFSEVSLCTKKYIQFLSKKKEYNSSQSKLSCWSKPAYENLY